MLSCRSKGTLDQDREMTTHDDLEGSNTYHDRLEGKDEAHHRLIMKS